MDSEMYEIQSDGIRPLNKEGLALRILNPRSEHSRILSSLAGSDNC